MVHPSPELLVRIAYLLQPCTIESVNHLLLTAALSDGDARRLAPLLCVVENDIDRYYAKTFAAPNLRDRAGVVTILRELATHDCAEEHCGTCAELGARIRFFAHALARVDDPFFRQLGRILEEEVLGEVDLPCALPSPEPNVRRARVVSTGLA
jgi:hypothetical protein